MTDFQNWWDGYFHEINGQKETAQAAWQARGELDKALAETQEPVAYQPTSQEQSVMHQAMIRSSKLVHKATPPRRQWVGLSNDDLYKILNDNIGSSSYAIARAISEALRGKNNA
jgi:hypothetical protein